MLPRLLLILIPILTFTIRPRWFSFYATLMILFALVQILMIALVTEEAKEAYASFGIEVVVGYIALNLALLGVRYWLIRRARARILKLPAPKE